MLLNADVKLNICFVAVRRSCPTCVVKFVSLSLFFDANITFKLLILLIFVCLWVDARVIVQAQKKLAIFRVFPHTCFHDDQGTFRLHGQYLSLAERRGRVSPFGE